MKEVSLTDMRSLALELEQRYCLPENTFTLTDEGVLHTRCHVLLRGDDHPHLYSMTSSCSMKLSSLMITTTLWDEKSIESFILASLYWEHFADSLGLSSLVFKLTKEVSRGLLLFNELTVSLSRLGYNPLHVGSYYKKVNLHAMDILMTGKLDLNQLLIDCFLADSTFEYHISEFNHEMRCKFYCSGKMYRMSFHFRDAQFYVNCKELNFVDTIIDGRLHDFMKKILQHVVKINRLPNLFSPSKHHFQMLTQFWLIHSMSDTIYNHLIKHYTAEEIEIECAHREPKTVFFEMGTITSMTLFDQTYSCDSFTKEVYHNNALLV